MAARNTNVQPALRSELLPDRLPGPFAAALMGQCPHWPSLQRVWLFGSRARGDHRPRSDIDLAFERDALALDWYAITEWLEETAPTLGRNSK